jgi:hypothetical protein
MPQLIWEAEAPRVFLAVPLFERAVPFLSAPRKILNYSWNVHLAD